MTNMIPVTVITYQGQTLEQAAAEFIRRTKTQPGIIYMDAKRQTVWILLAGNGVIPSGIFIYMDAKRQTVWIPYTGWTPKEQE